MGRRAARKGKSKKPQIEIEIEMEMEMERRSEEEIKEMEEEIEEENQKGGFFACYLLCSRCPRHKGHTYIGFTVNPRRRIKQHNGEMRCGAWRTKRGRPWEMILCIYGFPSNVSALQFEWAWQHPTESLAVRKAASNFKSLSGIANKIKLAYTMLNLPSWDSLNLTVNFFSTTYMTHIGGCPRLPKKMRVNVCVMDELPCYVEGHTVDGNNSDDEEENYEEEQINEDASPTTNSDSSANRIEGDDYPIEDCKETDKYSDDSPNPSESPLRCSLSAAPIDSSKTPNSCSVKQLKQPLSPQRTLNNEVLVDSVIISPEFTRKTLSFNCDDECSFRLLGDSNMLLSPQGNVINLETPSSYLVGKCNKSKVYSDVVDLTDSPIIIQL